jgi:outer membrane protein assembly factor BamD (BamD/ComL family)
VRQGRTAEAVQRLEHLILTYPGSAFVPEARRELERARGAIPRS